MKKDEKVENERQQKEDGREILIFHIHILHTYITTGNPLTTMIFQNVENQKLSQCVDFPLLIYFSIYVTCSYNIRDQFI